MCGRFTLGLTADAFASAFAVEVDLELEPRLNIAPTQPIATVVQSSQDFHRQLQLMRWGLIPSWAKDAAIGNKLINARSETVMEKPSFRAAFKYRRCLIPADGFYEWKKLERRKQPYYFYLHNHNPFAFAGLWESWNDILTCTILTTKANERVQPIHERMPVILHPKDYDRWLDSRNQTSSHLVELLKPFPSQEMEAQELSDANRKFEKK
jgi:putative SOS response-associated peptidase YedK